MRRLLIAAAAAVLPIVAHAESPKLDIITNPAWAKKPSPGDLTALYPSMAKYRQIAGWAVISCVAAADNTLADCRVVEETPQSAGFGKAALAAARFYELSPRQRNGAPVTGGSVVVPVKFGLPHPQTGTLFGPDASVPATASWASAPTKAELTAAYPQQAARTGAGGAVELRCHVKSDGGLDGCAVAHEWPRGQGFADAALKLVPKFRYVMDGVPPDVAAKLVADVPFDFSPPAADAAGRRLDKPEWVRALPADKAQEVFPPKAADAQLTTGRAVLDCVADGQGTMTGCQIVSEDPAGMDFGPAAVRVASAMAVNPWTADGVPADGAHVKFALRLNRAPDAAPAPASGAPK